MTFPNDNTRKLSYNLRGVETLNSETDNTPISEIIPDFFPVDPDEKVTIGLNVSLNEYVALATSVDVGRDIAFGEDSIKLWFLWLRALREYAMINCEDVANCIETSPAVQTAITNEYQSTVNEFLLSSGIVNPNQIDPETTTYPDRYPEHATQSISPFTDEDPCDLDALWAGIRECVERLDRESRDLLEDVNVYVDRVEQVFAVIDLVPLLGDIIQDVSEFFTELVPDLLNGFNAFSSPSALDNVACDLFCLVKDECRYPTYDEFLEYFTSRSVAGLASSPQLLNYTQVWAAVSAVPAGVGSLVWHTMVAWNILTMGFGGKWNGTYGKNTLRIWCSFGEDLPNNNWEILCDCPVIWEVIYDFSGNNLNGFAVTHGSFQTATGFGSGSSGSNRIAQIQKNYPEPITGLTEVEYTVTFDGVGTVEKAYLFTNTTPLIPETTITVFNAPVVLTRSTAQDFTAIQPYLLAGTANQGYAEVQKIILRGVGGYIPT